MSTRRRFEIAASDVGRSVILAGGEVEQIIAWVGGFYPVHCSDGFCRTAEGYLNCRRGHELGNIIGFAIRAADRMESDRVLNANGG